MHIKRVILLLYCFVAFKKHDSIILITYLRHLGWTQAVLYNALTIVVLFTNFTMSRCFRLYRVTESVVSSQILKSRRMNYNCKLERRCKMLVVQEYLLSFEGAVQGSRIRVTNRTLWVSHRCWYVPECNITYLIWTIYFRMWQCFFVIWSLSKR